MDASAPSSLYRAVWRWHFYAGLIVMPFLVLLAVTGGVYLFKPEIEHVLYRDLIDVAPGGEAVTASRLQSAFETALDGKVIQMTLPSRADRSVQALVRTPSGEVRNAYANPYDGRVLGSTSYGGVMQFVRKLHSLQQFGFWASCLIEIAAGWAIIMVLTGIFLWWPRGARGGVASIRGAPKQRVFWRDTHAVVGVFAGVFIVFLAMTGMPWSMFWGKNVQTWATTQGLGTPAAPAQVTPYFLLGLPGPASAHHHGREHVPTTPWAMEMAIAPHSTSDHGESIGIDDAVRRFHALGVERPFGIQPPEGTQGAWAATYLPDQAERVRLVYLDQHTGDVIGDVGYADYGAASKFIEWGIAVHQGQEYGALNRYVMLAACLAIVALVVSAVLMWWKRRPKGKLGAPSAPESKRAAVVAFAVIAIVGLVYPLTGLSIVIALGLDWLFGALKHALARA